jgi:hypothetical protein
MDADWTFTPEPVDTNPRMDTDWTFTPEPVDTNPRMDRNIQAMPARLADFSDLIAELRKLGVNCS